MIANIHITDNEAIGYATGSNLPYPSKCMVERHSLSKVRLCIYTKYVQAGTATGQGANRQLTTPSAQQAVAPKGCIWLVESSYPNTDVSPEFVIGNTLIGALAA